MRLARLALPALVLVLSACGGGGTKTVTETIQHTVTVTTPTETKPSEATVRVYFLRDGRVAPVARRVSASTRDELLRVLAEGPTDLERQAGLTTAVSGQGVNPADRRGLAQVVYTLTQSDPSSEATVGGKHYTRADFEDQTPAILVESPLPFQIVKSPLHATGTANTFEATFLYELTDPDGKVIKKGFVTATSGSGVRGTFDFTAPFTAAKGGQGKLTVYESSAKDGSRIHVVEIPIDLLR